MNWRFSNRNQGVPRDFFDGGNATQPKTKWWMRRDRNVKRLDMIPDEGEPFWSKDDKDLWVGDGVTPGGIRIGGVGGAGGTLPYTLDNSLFDGETTFFEGLLPALPDRDFAVVILRSGAGVLFDSENTEPNPGQFFYSEQDVTFGTPPREGDQAVAIFVRR